MNPDEIVPPALRSFLTITEVDDAGFLAADLFRRKFGHSPPDCPHHLAALYRDPHGALHVAGYSHMRPFGDVCLSGGSCTNGDTIRRMQPAERDALYAAGGVLHLLLRYGFRRYADSCEAYFGHCGDPRALEVTLAAGFVKTEHWPVIVHWHKPLPDDRRRALTAKVVALGPF